MEGHRLGEEGCDAPGFQVRIIDANALANPVKHIDLGQTVVNLGHHLKNLADKP
jgi:hypothetical protein